MQRYIFTRDGGHHQPSGGRIHEEIASILQNILSTAPKTSCWQNQSTAVFCMQKRSLISQNKLLEIFCKTCVQMGLDLTLICLKYFAKSIKILGWPRGGAGPKKRNRPVGRVLENGTAPRVLSEKRNRPARRVLKNGTAPFTGPKKWTRPYPPGN